MELKKIQMEDRDLLERYLSLKEDKSCDMIFPNIYLWSGKYKVKYAIVEDCLVFGEEGRKDVCCSFPFGTFENKKRAIQHFMKHAVEQEVDWFFNLTTESDFSLLEEWFPGCFSIDYNPDRADYVYESEKLATLAGKKYHKKKNHVNKFKSLYSDWSYERITDTNVEDCFQMALKWRTLNGCEEDEEKRDEMCVTLNALRLLKELKLTGGLLRVDEQVVAFAIGEELRKDMFCIHIEKALTEYQGAYAMINQQFTAHEIQGRYAYVNREEDTGAEGLRKAKESYRPVFMVRKGYAKLDRSKCKAYI